MTRLSEKTIEINYCSQLNLAMGGGLIWFGLTQRQEALLGFDAMTNLGGHLLILQFKASNNFVAGARRFLAPHHQMLALQALAAQPYTTVNYILPTIGTNAEFIASPNILINTKRLSAANIPATIGVPFTPGGTPRVNGSHYIDLYASENKVYIHSDPIEVSLESDAFLDRNKLKYCDKLSDRFNGNFNEFWNLMQSFSKNTYGVIILK